MSKKSLGYKIKYKQEYIKGYFAIKSNLKKFSGKDITPNEYFKKYVSLSKEYDANKNIDRVEVDNEVLIYKLTPKYRYLIAIIPKDKDPKLV